MAQATYVQTGARIDYTPAVAVTAGDIVVQNAELLGIASADIAAVRLGALAIEGVFDVAKQAGVLTKFEVGDNVYWDDLNDRAVMVGGGNAYLGKCIRSAANNDTSVRLKLAPLERHEQWDFLIAAEDLAIAGNRTLPERGDRIKLPRASHVDVFEVMPLAGEDHWRWSDGYELLMRIHTKFVGRD